MSSYRHPEEFKFGYHWVTVETEEYYDTFLMERERYCAWLMEHDAWRDLGVVSELSGRSVLRRATGGRGIVGYFGFSQVDGDLRVALRSARAG